MIDGCEIAAHDAKAEALTSYFSSILGQSHTPQWQFNLEHVYRDVHIVDLSSLVVPFSVTEAKEAIRQMNRNSAPGPDGFGPGFYTAAWDTVEEKVMNFVNAFAAGEADLERLNRAFVVLLPKKPGAISPADYRPICLQNCSLRKKNGARS